MKFFEKNIKTSFLHYSTCFGGGVNQTFFNDELKKLNVSFIVSSEGMAETSTYGTLLSLLIFRIKQGIGFFLLNILIFFLNF